MRRFFRLTLLSIGLAGCAAVLAIDDIPMPDPADGGTLPDGTAADGTSSGALDGPLSGDDTGAQADVDAPDGSIAVTIDAGFFVIKPDGVTFDPSAVAWSPVEKLLYIGDNAPRAVPGSDGGAVWTWQPDDGGLAVLSAVPLPLSGERFGQLLRQSDSLLLIPEFAGSRGHLFAFDYDLPKAGNRVTKISEAGAFFGAAESDGIFVTAQTGSTWKFELFGEQNGTANTPVTVLDGSVGIVARPGTASSPTIFIAGADGALYRYANASGPAVSTGVITPAGLGFIVDGPDGSIIAATKQNSLVLIRIDGSKANVIPPPGAELVESPGAFAYDDATRRLFIPQAAAGDAGGKVLVIHLPPDL